MSIHPRLIKSPISIRLTLRLPSLPHADTLFASIYFNSNYCIKQNHCISCAEMTDGFSKNPLAEALRITIYFCLSFPLSTERREKEGLDSLAKAKINSFTTVGNIWRITVIKTLTWDQALFSFHFVNNIPAGMAKRKESPISAAAVRENVWELLKLGLISGYKDTNTD